MTASTSRLAESAAPLDALLVDAALGPVRRFAPDLSTASRRPRSRAAGPPPGGWARWRRGRAHPPARRRSLRAAGPPVHRRGVDGEPAAAPGRPGLPRGGQTAERLVVDADLDWRDDQRARFLVENVVGGARPEQRPARQPVVGQGGHRHRRAEHRPRGARPCVRTWPRAAADPARWSTAPPSRSAGTSRSRPGAVVLRTEVLRADPVHAADPDRSARCRCCSSRPTINKFYAIDLAPGRSLVEYLVGQGQQVFVMSWRNPDARHADWNFDTYVQAVLDALDAVERLTEPDQAALDRHLLRRHPRPLTAGVPRRDRPAGPAGRVLPVRHRARQRACRA